MLIALSIEWLVSNRLLFLFVDYEYIYLVTQNAVNKTTLKLAQFGTCMHICSDMLNLLSLISVESKMFTSEYKGI